MRAMTWTFGGVACWVVGGVGVIFSGADPAVDSIKHLMILRWFVGGGLLIIAGEIGALRER